MESPEPIIDPALPIIDPHHHLWFISEQGLASMNLAGGDCANALGRTMRTNPVYMFDDFLRDISAGHNIRASVFIEVHSMYRADGPAHLKSVGEIEFANGMAAMGASGVFGDVKICAGIIGATDLRQGDVVQEVLEKHIAAGGGRYRGVRSQGICYDASLEDLNQVLGSEPHVLADRRFREGFRRIAALGLHYEAFQLEPQLPELFDLAKAFPETQIVLNHMGMPIGCGAFANRHKERFAAWRRSIRDLSALPNIVVKLGGLGNTLCGFSSTSLGRPATSTELAAEWGPYVETCIEAFGPDRCMFESNFPVDLITAPYTVIWNAFKRMAAGASQQEKHDLFYGTASRIYKLDGVASPN